MNKIIVTVILLSALVVSFFIATSGTKEVAASEIIETYNSLSPQAKSLYYQQSDELTKPVPDRLVELDQKTIGCFGPNKVLLMSSEQTNMGGQCCGALTDFEAYEVQLEALEHFIEEHGNNELIPRDPYDIPVETAQKLTSFDRDIELSLEDREVYEEAMEISHHGPCCCKCWKWYMMSGLGKKLIVDHGWNAEDVAELWDLSSSCGHDEDTNMHDHYREAGHTH